MGFLIKNCITARNLVNNHILSFVADEFRATHISPEEVEQFGLLFGEQYEINLDLNNSFYMD